MSFVVTALPGDGIGPEVTRAATEVLQKVCSQNTIDVTINEAMIGGVAIDAVGEPLPDETLTLCRQSDGILLGAVGGPKWDMAPVRPEQGLLKIRKELGLFANLRPVRIFPGLEELSPVKKAAGMDILIVRELTGGLYFGAHDEGTNAASDRCDYSAEEVTRVLQIAFDAAAKRGGRVTSVDKANVLATSRLWRHHADQMGADHPNVRLDHVLVDAMAMHLVTHPADFDVLVTENLFGDILSDEAAAISGSIGLAASASLGAPGTPGLYEPIHGSAPDIAGQNLANPAGAILSAAMLLRFGGGFDEAATEIEGAVEAVIGSGLRTHDLGGTAHTDEFTSAVLAKL